MKSASFLNEFDPGRGDVHRNARASILHSPIFRSFFDRVDSARPLTLRRIAPFIYFLLAAPSYLMLLFAFPNFQAPDDPDHFKRAYTLLHQPFKIITPEGKNSGGMIDSNLKHYADAQLSIVSRPDYPGDLSQSGSNKLDHVRWAGSVEYVEMPGAISYLPFLYAPQSIIIWVGTSFDLTVAQTVLLARFVNGALAIALVTVALALLPGGHAFVLVLLFLPRTMLQFPSNSADPLLFGLALLVVALSLRTRTYQGFASYLAMAAALFIAAAIRPPFAALGSVPIGLAFARKRIAGGLIMVIAVLAAARWILWVLPQINDDRCLGEKGGLAARVFAFVLNLPSVLFSTLAEHGDFYFYSLVAHYGFGDGPLGEIGSPMPGIMYSFALFLLAWAVRVDVATETQLPRLHRVLLFGSAALVMLVTFFAMFVACTAANSDVIAGVQGRYFIPALFAVAPAIAGTMHPKHAWSWRPLVVALFLWVPACVAIMLSQVTVLYRM